MAHPIRWLPPAAQDLEDIYNYIGARSQAYATGVIDRILSAVNDLARFPGMGPRVPDVRKKGVELREVLVLPYRVVYRIKNGHVVILAVVHGARLLRKVLKGRPLG